jgi:hypothetical protein
VGPSHHLDRLGQVAVLGDGPKLMPVGPKPPPGSAQHLRGCSCAGTNSNPVPSRTTWWRGLGFHKGCHPRATRLFSRRLSSRSCDQFVVPGRPGRRFALLLDTGARRRPAAGRRGSMWAPYWPCRRAPWSLPRRRDDRRAAESCHPDRLRSARGHGVAGGSGRRRPRPRGSSLPAAAEAHRRRSAATWRAARSWCRSVPIQAREQRPTPIAGGRHPRLQLGGSSNGCWHARHGTAAAARWR